MLHLRALLALLLTLGFAAPTFASDRGIGSSAPARQALEVIQVDPINGQAVPAAGRYIGDITVSAPGVFVCCDAGYVSVQGFGSLVLTPIATTVSAFSAYLQFAVLQSDTIYGRQSFLGGGGQLELDSTNPVTGTGTGGGNALVTDVFGDKFAINAATVTGGSVTYRVFGRTGGIRPRTLQLKSLGTDRSATVSTTAANLWPTNNVRAGGYVRNDSATDIWCNPQTTATAAAGSGNLRIAASGGEWRLHDNSVFTGALSCVVATGSAAISSREF